MFYVKGAHTGLEPCNSFQRHCDKITSVPITEVKMLMAPRDKEVITIVKQEFLGSLL